MYIGDFSKITGINEDTLRYYEKIGLISPERIGNNRDYTNEDKIRIETIVYLKDLNFTLSEIKEILTLDDVITSDIDNGRFDSDKVNKLRAITENKLKYLEEKEIEMAIVKNILKKMLKKLSFFEEKKEIPKTFNINSENI